MYIADNKKSGKLIVFLHGVGSSHKMWNIYFEKLDGYHCLAPDLPEHGLSNNLRWTSLDKTTEEIFQMIKETKEGKAHFVG